jgi:hypothetical protein
MTKRMRLDIVLVAAACFMLMCFTVKADSQEESGALQNPAEQQTPAVQKPPVSIKKQWAGLTVTAELSISPLTYVGTCPATFTIKGVIYANRAVEVLYKFVRSDNIEMKPLVLTFTEQGKKEITYTWQLGDALTHPTFNEWTALEVVFPLNRKIRSNVVFIKGSCS